MKVGEVTQRIQNLYSKGVDPDDTRMSNRIIYNKFIGVRAKLMSQRLAKGSDKNDLSGWDYQQIRNIEMQDYNWNSLPNCHVKRSAEKIPKTITDGSDEHIIVTSSDGNIRYNVTKFERVKYTKGQKYTSTAPYTFIYDDYLFTVNSKAAKVSIKAIFRDPIDAYMTDRENVDGEEPCIKYTDIDVFTPDDIVDVAVEMSTTELIDMFVKFGVEDRRNDSSDNPSERSK